MPARIFAAHELEHVFDITGDADITTFYAHCLTAVNVALHKTTCIVVPKKTIWHQQAALLLMLRDSDDNEFEQSNSALWEVVNKAVWEDAHYQCCPEGTQLESRQIMARDKAAFVVQMWRDPPQVRR